VARSAPAIERCVAVLNHLASQPGQQFTLSDLARALDLNKATAHAMLATLTEAGYLLRDPQQKTYGLGPALIAVGNAATQGNPAVRIAEPLMAELSAELDLELIASAAIADEIVILARAGPVRPLGINVQPGTRLPLAPPLGTVFVAWSGPAAIDRWLGHVGPEQSPADLERYRDALRVVRARGYSVALGGESQQQLVEALRQAGHEPPRTRRSEEYALIELAGTSRYRINHIGVPVFGPAGEVSLALFLIGFRGQITADEVPRFAERLRAVADEVTTALRGRLPDSAEA
jgi:DNA-binding IclR family transcriptional regulator